MNSETSIPTFNLLSIGHRGVGKTVFLAGSYAESNADRQAQPHHGLSIEPQNEDERQKIDSILSYILRTGHYPPPTMKVADFSFSLKRRRWWGNQTLSHFRWMDVPGEICTIHNREFRAIVSNSHGCCVFVDAYALVHNSSYPQILSDIIKQTIAIASLAHLHDFQYSFSIILTKCDLLKSSLPHQQLQQNLQPFIHGLDAVKADYRVFHSCVPLLRTSSAVTVKPQGASVPIKWLVWDLSRAENPRQIKTNIPAVGNQQKVAQQQMRQHLLGSSLWAAVRNPRTLAILVITVTALLSVARLSSLQLNKQKSPVLNLKMLNQGASPANDIRILQP